MRYALIMAGGSGTRLWPMSRADVPKQLIPLIEGKSLLRLAFDRFDGLLPIENRYVCAGLRHREAALAAVPGLDAEHFLGEPLGRDTLSAVGFGAAVLATRDPEAVIGVFTADHLIEPVAEFQRVIEQGFTLVEQSPRTLVTFGIAPTGPVTAYGYLELAAAIEGGGYLVRRFQEKPPLATAEEYFRQGPQHYLWNSGMFVWRADTLLDCIRRYEPAVHHGLARIARAWDTPGRAEAVAEVYPALKKISVDFAVMEPAAADAAVRVAAIPMQLQWLDIGSWPALAATRPHDERGNALAAARHLLLESDQCLVASSDPRHLVALVGCRDLIVIHTDHATLVCRADMAEQIKALHEMVVTRFGPEHA